jgi:hypothetical protein
VHRPDGFFDRGFDVGPVAEIEVEVIDLEPFQAGVTGVGDVLAVEPAVHRAVAAPEDLGRDREGVPRPVQELQRFAHHLLGPATFVAFGIVEEIDAVIESHTDQPGRGADVELLGKGDPGTEGELADLEASLAEAAISHAKSRIDAGFCRPRIAPARGGARPWCRPLGGPRPVVASSTSHRLDQLQPLVDAFAYRFNHPRRVSQDIQRQDHRAVSYVLNPDSPLILELIGLI